LIVDHYVLIGTLHQLRDPQSTIGNYLGSGFDGLDGGAVGFDSDFEESVDEPVLFSEEDDSDLVDEELMEDPVFL
jgi:hypothetical protein